MKVSLTQNTIDSSDIKALSEWLAEEPWITMGPLTREFEQKFADWIGRKYAVFVNSGSSANLAAYAALQEYQEMGWGHNALVPIFGWSTSVAPAIQLGYTTRLVDACPDTWGMDPNRIEHTLKEQERALGPRPTVVCVAHTIGCPTDMDPVIKLKEDYGFMILEDTCSSYGSTYKGEKLGTFGDVSTFSFFYNHQASTAEGGMICTDDEELYHLLVMYRAHGWTQDLPEEFEAEIAENTGRTDINRRFTFMVPGFNVRPTDIQAFLGLRQMNKIDRMCEARIANHRMYVAEIKNRGLPLQVQVCPYSEICSISLGLAAESSDQRDGILLALNEAEIDNRPVVGGSIAKQPFWTQRFGELYYPVSDDLHDRLLAVPNHSALTADQILYVVDALERGCS
jgi:CDP-4-dehydro-6-deoxyglucose reductase, E1